MKFLKALIITITVIITSTVASNFWHNRNSEVINARIEKATSVITTSMSKPVNGTVHSISPIPETGLSVIIAIDNSNKIYVSIDDGSKFAVGNTVDMRELRVLSGERVVLGNYLFSR